LFLVAFWAILPGQNAVAQVEASAKPPATDERPPEKSPAPQLVARQMLERARQAWLGSQAGLASAIGELTFETQRRESWEDQPRLVVKGRAKIYFDRGKYHLRIAHDTRLARIIALEQGEQLVSMRPTQGKYLYRTKQGDLAEREATFVDDKPDSVFVTQDGSSVYSVTNSTNIHPNGYRYRTHRRLSEACGSAAGLEYDHIVLGASVLDMDFLVKTLGPDAIQVLPLAGGGFRGFHGLLNAPQVRVEFDVLPEAGFHMAAVRITNDQEPRPTTTYAATWKEIDGVWYVQRLVEENNSLHRENGMWRRSVLEYREFQVNPWVDPDAFSRKAIEYATWSPRSQSPEEERE
jgi:hypothetical protein